MTAPTLKTLSLWLLSLALGLVSVGCGCQNHEVSPVTVSPSVSCLTAYAGGDIAKPGAVGLCESLLLFGTNSCADPLEISMPEAEGSAPEQKTAPAGEAFMFEVSGWSQRTYDFQAQLGSQVLALRFSVGEQCGLTGGSCD